MCSPRIMNFVNKELSRRNLFKMAIVGSAAAAAAASLPRASAQATMNQIDVSNVVDLSHRLHSGFPMWPGTASPEKETVVTVKDNGFYGNIWKIWEHTATHLDAPAHFIEGGTTADNIPIENFIAPIAVIDIEKKVEDNADATLDIEDIAAWESTNGLLPDRAVVMMYSGWEKRVNDADAFINTDSDEVMHFPGFNPEAAEFLVKERNITGIAVDTLSLDPGNSTTFGTHIAVLGAEKWGLENVANLKSIPEAGATLIVGVLKNKDASGGPVRLMAVWG